MLSPAVTAPATPTPVEEIAAALDHIAALHGLPLEDRLWLARHGQEVVANPATFCSKKGAPAEHMVLILKGEIHVRRQHGGPMALFIGRTGQMTGVLPFSRMKGYGGQGFAVSPVWALLIHRSLFPEMLAGHTVDGAARGFHAARPRARGHPHRAAGGKAGGSGPTGRQSGARTEQSRLGRAARRRQPARRFARQPRQPAQAHQSAPDGRADRKLRGMGGEDPQPHGPIARHRLPKPMPWASSPARNRSAPGSTPSAAPTRGRSPRNWPSRA